VTAVLIKIEEVADGAKTEEVPAANKPISSPPHPAAADVEDALGFAEEPTAPGIMPGEPKRT
jgi:hypothetical protein